MKRRSIIEITYLFVGILVLALPIISEGSWTISLIKPLIGLVLFIACLQYSGPGQTLNFLIGGVVLSWAGDVLLMFEGELFFLLGLGSFLLAQVSYSIMFLIIGSRPLANPINKILLIGVLAYLGSFLYLVGPSLGEMLIPVSVYGIAISAMVILAIGLNGEIKNPVFIRILLGAVFFVVSDSLLAIDKFVDPISNARLWVMSTYMIGQFGIVFGTLKFYDP